MKISELLEALNIINVFLKENIDVDKENGILDITDNSKKIKPSSAFFCKGAHFKKEYLLQSMEQGALVFITDKVDLYDAHKNGILVSDVRKTMAYISNMFFGEAWKNLKLIGITGTKGKSTTTYLLKSIIDTHCDSKGKKPAGILSSIENFDGSVFEESHLTTPEPIDLHRHFNNMVNNNIEYCIMEVSSQALKYNRVDGITFDYGGFLNIGRDHISDIEHPNFEDYFFSKSKLFEISNMMFINEIIDFEKSGYNIGDFKGKLKHFGFTEKAEIRCINYIKKDNGFEFEIKDYDKTEKYFLPMAGIFNIENALCAIGIAKDLNISYENIYQGLKKAKVSGRMELFLTEDKKTTIIVDYAHNKLSFEKLYESIKSEYPGYEITTIFGCPGGKAQERRKDLGEISGQESDKVFITEEDPGEEPLEKICEEIYLNAKDKKAEVEIILDREVAIKKAIVYKSSKNQIILITGKGRETRQKRGIKYIDTKSDVQIVDEAIGMYNQKNKGVI